MGTHLLPFSLSFVMIIFGNLFIAGPKSPRGNVFGCGLHELQNSANSLIHYILYLFSFSYSIYSLLVSFKLVSVSTLLFRF